MKLKSCKHQSFEKVEKKNEERKKKEPVSAICLMDFLVVLNLRKQYCKIISYFRNTIYGIFQINKNKLLNMKVEIFI